MLTIFPPEFVQAFLCSKYLIGGNQARFRIVIPSLQFPQSLR